MVAPNYEDCSVRLVRDCAYLTQNRHYTEKYIPLPLFLVKILKLKLTIIEIKNSVSFLTCFYYRAFFLLCSKRK